MNLNGKSAMASSAFAAGVETFCRADPVFSRAGDEFDRDNYLLNTPDGVVDLRTGQIRDSVPDDYLTKMTNVSPSREGGEVFLKFMDQITLGDQELIEFHQVSLGACLSGAMEAHWMLFWIGAGRNGKNTLGDLIQYIYGDYAKKILSSVLMSKTHEAHPAEIAQLDGCRLATSSEVDEGSFWHESKINELTGDATLSARFMNQNFFEFVRTHKHLIYGNHRPQLRSVTPAIRSRIKIVPFPASFLGREDATLPTKLKGCAPFVLQWLIDGHTKWLAAGRKLPNCQTIERESDDYFASQSTVELWISEKLEQRQEISEKAGILYENYRHWKLDRGESPVSATRWGETMGKKFSKIKSHGSVRYQNVKVRIEYENNLNNS
jgi:putative DNA primase/helicase